MEALLRHIKKNIPHPVFLRAQPAYHFFIAFAAAVWYGFPSRHIQVIGVTGTKGKTTVVELAREVLGAGGGNVASLSSLRFVIGKQEARNMTKMTMPGRFFVQKFLRDAVRQGCKYAILEVTSEGIKQFRHRFIRFHAAILTNMAPEHLESHGGFEPYLRAKLDLFWRLTPEGRAIINQEDAYADRFAAATNAHKDFYKKEGFALGGKTYVVRNLEVTKEGIQFDLNNHTITSSMPGMFNFYNILSVLALGLGEHIALEKIANSIAQVHGIPGRMELLQQEPFRVIVDYAHTPGSLAAVYETLRVESAGKDSRMLCVLGAAGGGRDKWKRPLLGKIAAEFCDMVFLTNEDSYDEDPQEIINDLAGGLFQALKHSAQSAKKIVDRRTAIHEALHAAIPGDVIIITGKGAEPWIAGPGGTKIPWDDRAVVREELQQL